jgi:hypothetical protein
LEILPTIIRSLGELNQKIDAAIENNCSRVVEFLRPVVSIFTFVCGTSDPDENEYWLPYEVIAQITEILRIQMLTVPEYNFDKL